MNRIMQFGKYAVLAAVIVLVSVSCRAEQQNVFRRQVLDLANVRMYIILYSLEGKELFRGEVDGKVTRAERADSNGGEYVYWFDPSGKYYQTNLPYLVTTDANRTGVLTRPITP